MEAGGTRSTIAPSFRRREDFSVLMSEGMQLDLWGWKVSLGILFMEKVLFFFG